METRGIYLTINKIKSNKAAPKSLTTISIVKPVREAAMLTKIALHSR